MLQIRQLYMDIDKMLKKPDTPGMQIESKKALAVAYANLLLENPEMVTAGHLQILKKQLNHQEVRQITNYILEQSGIKSIEFQQTFAKVFGNGDPPPSITAA